MSAAAASPAKKQRTMAATALKLFTWNVAAVNNNPFEYWITHDDPAYNTLMVDVQAFLDAPGERDVRVDAVFTPAMCAELCDAMRAAGWSGVDTVAAMWAGDDGYGARRIVSGFLKDKALGAKRLASMPDRVTNTINTADGGRVFRPTVINMYKEAMPDGAAWWAQWKRFMFSTKVAVKGKGDAGAAQKTVCELLVPIKRSKYPAVTEAEEAVSVPLQCLCQAIFDAVLVHMLNTLAPGTWHALKMQMCEALVDGKPAATLALLAKSDADVLCVQEASAAFAESAAADGITAAGFACLAPAKLDGKRDQNSLVFLRKTRFDTASAREITAECITRLRAAVADAPVADGDLYACVVKRASDGAAVCVASFHGDTNGLATMPVVDAVRGEAAAQGVTHMLFGLDANSHWGADNNAKKLGVGEFKRFCNERALACCWSQAEVDAGTLYTTYNARTYLQPQLNKAVPAQEKDTSPLTDKNLKDWVLIGGTGYVFADGVAPVIDNGGTDGPFPTLSFPSDHASVTCVLNAKL